ncbi:MAG: glycosyltransferase family 4 protein [Candidatus Neomarinimicrobiota bacterium]
MQTKTKILHLIGSLNPGGVQTYLLNISNYDKVHRIKREVWTLYQKEGSLYNEFLKKNINVSSCQIIPADKNWRPYFLWKRLRKLAGIFYFFRLFGKLQNSKPDLVILDEPVRLLTQFLVIRLLNIPMIWNIHAERSITKNKILFKWMYKYFLKKNLTIISDSKHILLKNLSYMKDCFYPSFDKIPIIHATVDFNSFLSIKINDHREGSIIFGSIGRLNWAKGYDLLIKTLYRIKKEHPNFYLKIAGDGPYRNMLENMIDKYYLRKNILILGELHYNDIPKFLLSIDLYIQPSVSEGSPITLKEAMASSLPILASTAGGIPEIIEHNKTGILFENENTVELEKGLKKIITMDKSLRQEMGLRARESSLKRFDIEKTAQTLNDIYNEVLKNNYSV